MIGSDLSLETDAKTTPDYTADAMFQFYLQLGGKLEVGDLEKSNMSDRKSKGRRRGTERVRNKARARTREGDSCSGGRVQEANGRRGG